MGNAAKLCAEPENIKPGILYYSDDYTVENEMPRLGEERNYEEVYKNYEYYEALYDENNRVKIFRAYKRGEVILEEAFSFHPGGSLAKKVIIRKGKSVETIEFDP